MRNIVAAASRKVAAAYGIDPQEVGRACSNRPDGRGFVSDAVASRPEGQIVDPPGGR